MSILHPIQGYVHTTSILPWAPITNKELVFIVFNVMALQPMNFSHCWSFYLTEVLKL